MKAAAALLALCLTGPAAQAAVTVLGSSPARACYLAAREGRQGVSALGECDVALSGSRGVLDARDRVATLVNRGILRMYAGNVAGAVADYDAAIADDPREAEAWLNKGVALFRSGAAREAVPMFGAALDRRTRMPALAHYARGLAHEELGDLRAAYADLTRARELSPEWSAPTRELARYRVSAGGGGL